MKRLKKYKNWDFTIEIFSDWTKTITWEWKPKFPICIDVKITDYCDAWCAYCHEKSTVEWKHCDVENIKIFWYLPKWTEIAIWGGNPLSHPKLGKILYDLKDRFGLIPNLTVNSFHLKDPLLQELIDDGDIYWLWVSYNRLFKKDIINLKYENMVVHTIAWIHTYDEILELLKAWKKVLILGYKTFWRWINYSKWMVETIEKNILELYRKLPYLFWEWVLSFDNLAIEQLKPQRFFTKETWESRYMGDDGQFTMYIDLVKNEYGLNSISNTRYKIPKFKTDGHNQMEEIFQKIYDLK